MAPRTRTTSKPAARKASSPRRRRALRRNPEPLTVHLDELTFRHQQRDEAASVGDICILEDGHSLARIAALAEPDLVTLQPIPATVDQFDSALKRWTEFTGEEADQVDLIELDESQGSRAVWLLGTCLAIEYRTSRNYQSLDYRHAFHAQARPMLAVTHDGSALLILGGDFRVTERGITDRGE